MTTQEVLLHHWYWDPLAVALCAVVLAAFIGSGFRKRAVAEQTRSGCFYIGLAILILALLSPVATLARSYLFSAHMLQHLLLLLVVPPLFLLGIFPGQNQTAGAGAPVHKGLGDLLPSRSPVLKFERSAVFIPLSWLAGVGSMWLWHVPTLCNAATASPALYHFQTVSLLGLGALFWWPIVGPRASRQLTPLAGIAYLVTACFACTGSAFMSPLPPSVSARFTCTRRTRSACCRSFRTGGA